MNSITVLIADDHIHEREGFKQLLSLVNDIEVIGDASSAQGAVEKTLALRPDVILLDLKWYQDVTAGISAIEQIKSTAPDSKILVATAYENLIPNARHAGADVAVVKDSLFDKATLATRIRDAYNSLEFPPPQAEMIEQLTDRELEVLQVMALGKTDAQIADDLTIAVTTVKKHVRHILGKLEVNNRTGAIATAYERGILKRGDLQKQ